MGDNAYPRANRTQYANCSDNYNLDSSFSTYDPSRPDWWGRYKDHTMPVLGNHEYLNTDDPTTQSQPYFDYFGAQGGFKAPAAPVPDDPNNDNNHGLKFGEGYYSYDLGSWHVVALNSNCGKVGGCDASSPQGNWLQSDFANHPAQCTLAYFHHPIYATTNGTNTLDVKPFWDMLYASGADVILAGHAHRYELHAPMTPEGVVDSTNGIRMFVVGTGGEPGGSVIDPNQVPQGVLQKVISDKFGVIKLDLDAGSYDWEYVAVDGTANGTVLDSGSDQCHGAPDLLLQGVCGRFDGDKICPIERSISNYQVSCLGEGKGGADKCSALALALHSPECVEGLSCELRVTTRSGCRSEKCPPGILARPCASPIFRSDVHDKRQTRRKAGTQCPRASLSEGGGRAAEKESS